MLVSINGQVSDSSMHHISLQQIFDLDLIKTNYWWMFRSKFNLTSGSFHLLLKIFLLYSVLGSAEIAEIQCSSLSYGF